MTPNAVRASRAQRHDAEMETRVIWDDGGGADETEKQYTSVSARLPNTLIDYAKKVMGSGETTRGLIVIIRFHKKFFERLITERKKLQMFALDEDLNWPSQAPEVLARLIRAGLDEHERRRK